MKLHQSHCWKKYSGQISLTSSVKSRTNWKLSAPMELDESIINAISNLPSQANSTAGPTVTVFTQNRTLAHPYEYVRQTGCYDAILHFCSISFHLQVQSFQVNFYDCLFLSN